jgi:hypothetical protein
MNTLMHSSRSTDTGSRLVQMAAGAVLALHALSAHALPGASDVESESLRPAEGLNLPLGAQTPMVAYSPWLAGSRSRFEMGLSLATQRAVWLENGGSPHAYRLNPNASPSDAPVMVVALRYNVSNRSRLFVESGVSSTPVYGPQSPEPGLRFGLEMKPAKNTTFGLSGGNLMRMQLKPYSDVALRLRGGRVGVTWRYQY